MLVQHRASLLRAFGHHVAFVWPTLLNMLQYDPTRCCIQQVASVWPGRYAYACAQLRRKTALRDRYRELTVTFK